MASGKNKKNSQGLTYKNKTLVRKGDMIYYGRPEDEYIITMKIQETKKYKDLNISSRISIELQKNDSSLKGKEKVVKKAEREGLYKALDIAAFWLEDALSS